MKVTDLEMYANPAFYDDVYLNAKRGVSKYTKECEAIDELINSLHLKRKVIDFACGTGTHLKFLGEMGYSGIGVDINNKMLEYAKQKNKHLPIRFKCGDIRNIRIKERFPVAISMYSAINYLETASDIEKTLKNIFNTLDKNGLFILDTRWAKHQPKDVLIEERGNGIIIARQWVYKKKNNMRDAVYKIAFLRNGKNGVLLFETHPQNFMDPFYLKGLMKKIGFKKINIYNNFDWSKPVDHKSSIWRSVITARKL